MWYFLNYSGVRDALIRVGVFMCKGSKKFLKNSEDSGVIGGGVLG